MQTLTGKTAFITGAAEGIGFHIARTFAQQGMNVMLADIDAAMLEQARQTLKDEGHSVAAVVCDVAKRDALEAAAKATLERFGKVHVLVNNAGVSVAGPQDRISEKNWRWIIDVNLMGVVYGAQVFVPLIKEHGEGGHVINVASVAGTLGMAFAGPYCATKAAVVSLSESWQGELKSVGIGVSVLCPAFAKSRIYCSERNRQADYGGVPSLNAQPNPRTLEAAAKAKAAVTNGIETHIVADRLLEAVLHNELYVFTHPHYRPVVEGRSQQLSLAFDSAEASPTLKNVAAGEITSL
ncbi:SDR family NAD(P)-dependent oxidoreductase [Pseudomonas sp.]|uniref:SDR family NAD(P)-dependent oxidoreductase n=1 Tax=Pseudomonas sp. TaxID=306 RepID=UPI00299D2049|nr:SDR family NAD(P)-dependent oxidoreductase [Pseudomonas sp.]MDX1369455.1 SDR family NAD(P)-dependent oxidoreductase [Pseudomonas sp.]